MRIKKEYVIFSFATTTEALSMEAKCNEGKIPGRLIPLPGEISAGCGLAWRITVQDIEIYGDEIEKLQIRYEGKRRLLL